MLEKIMLDVISSWQSTCITSELITKIIIGVIVAAIAIALVLYIYFNKKEMLYKAALYAVAKAEEEWGSGTGRIKFAEVYTYIKKEFPILTMFFTEAQLTIIIENALIDLKEILATKLAKEEKAQLENQETTTP